MLNSLDVASFADIWQHAPQIFHSLDSYVSIENDLFDVKISQETAKGVFC